MTKTTKILRLLVSLSLLAAPACHPRDGRPEIRQRELMHTGFEELPGWAPEVHPSITTEKVHSGKFAVRVDAEYPYSMSYRIELGKLCPTHRPRRFTLNAWVWVPRYQDDAVIVVAINNPDDPEHPVFSKSVYLTDSGPYQQWKRVSRDLDLPSGIHANSRLTIYLWRSSATEPVYADDFQLTELW